MIEDQIDELLKCGTDKVVSGDLAGAIVDYSNAIKLDSKCANAYACRGFVRRKSGDLYGALADLNRAIDLAPEHPVAYRFRAEAREASGDLDGSNADYLRMLELNPERSSRNCLICIARSKENDTFVNVFSAVDLKHFLKQWK